MDAEKEELKKQVAELQKRNLKLDAESFAENLVKESKIVPASKEAVIALFMQAKSDDAVNTATEVNFSNEKVCKTRVEVLEEFFSQIETHGLNKEELESKQPNVLNFNKGADSTVDVASVKDFAKNYAEKKNKVLNSAKK